MTHVSTLVQVNASLLCIIFSVSYDYEGDTYTIDYTESSGHIHMGLIWVSGHMIYVICLQFSFFCTEIRCEC